MKVFLYIKIVVSPWSRQFLCVQASYLVLHQMKERIEVWGQEMGEGVNQSPAASMYGSFV